MYEIEIIPESQRISFIDAQLKSSNEKYSTWDLYPMQRSELKVITLPISMPTYRMSNGRTSSTQLQYIEEQSLEETYFSNGQENEEVQQKQHELLSVMAQQSTDDSGDSIFEVLKKNPQKEPLLISPSGVVLNGNRRLAAMRELFAESPTTYSKFSNVVCAVLPELTMQQEIDLELKLQMSQNFKLEYSWVDEALMIEHGKKFHTIEELQLMMNKQRSHLNMMTRALFEAQLYLRYKLGRPHAYELVQNKFQLFKDLQKFTKDKPEDQAQSIRLVAWHMSDAANLEDRLYAYNFILTDQIEHFVNKVVDKEFSSFNVTLDDDANELEVSLGAVNPSKFDIFNETMKQLDQKQMEVAATIIESTAEKMKAELDAKKTGEDPLKLVTEIHTKLEKLDVIKAAPSTVEALKSQLEQIKLKTENFLKIINNKK